MSLPGELNDGSAILGSYNQPLISSEEKGSKLIELALAEPMLIQLTTENKKKEVSSEELNITEFIEIKGWKAIGNRLTADKVKKIKLLSKKYGEPEVIEEEKAEVKEAFTTKENPKYKGYYCPFVGHAKCEETDSPEKYHGVDAWTIDETFEGVSPPEHVPLGEFDQTRKVPSPWRALGVREREGEKALKEVLRQRRRGGGGGG